MVAGYLLLTRPWAQADLVEAVPDYVFALAWVIYAFVPPGNLRARKLAIGATALALALIIARAAWRVWGS
jgi:hypothetical protein